eukprot:Skav223125  [mRNA]  locus=scaffold470:32210:33745:+ [translate_table: standard]
MVIVKSLLVVLLWLHVQCWTASSCTTSEQDCEVDSSSYLQRSVRDVSVSLQAVRTPEEEEEETHPGGEEEEEEEEEEHPGDVSTTRSAEVEGDPHIDTFDNQNYLLLKQGTFSLWSYSGTDAKILSANHLEKKLPVDFQLYAHYSGHASYTKGLMLVDNSGGAWKRVLEITSQDCKWRTKAGDSSWSTVDEPQMLSLPDANGDEMTAFKMEQSQNGETMMYVKLLMKIVDGSFKDVGNLYVTCKPGRHINTKIAMASKEDIDLVQGQLGTHGHTEAGEDHSSQEANLLEGMHQRMRSDSEFETTKSWTDLGGSETAASYLNEADAEGPSLFHTCSEQEKIAAKATCNKYLGEARPSDNLELLNFDNHVESCVFDVCHGGGEVAAQLAAEIIQAK